MYESFAEYHEYGWDDEDWADSHYNPDLLRWSLYQDEEGRFCCTCLRYERNGKCFHTRYARRETVVKVKEQYL